MSIRSILYTAVIVLAVIYIVNHVASLRTLVTT